MSNEMDIGDLLREISSDSPAPGGGSVAALSGCFGAALVSMVCRLSIGKKKYKEFEDELKGVLSEAEDLGKELLDLSKKDVEAFKEVMIAYKTSIDEEEKEDKLQRAYKKAANVPFEAAKKCLRVMELAEITTLKGNQNAVTDSGVAAFTAYSGLKGAVFNVKVNLKYIDDRQYVAKMEDEIEIIETRADKIIEAVKGSVDRSLSS